MRFPVTATSAVGGGDDRVLVCLHSLSFLLRVGVLSIALCCLLCGRDLARRFRSVRTPRVPVL